MTVEELTPLLDLFGLLPESKRVVGRPRLRGEHHRVLAQLRKRYRVELENAAAARIGRCLCSPGLFIYSSVTIASNQLLTKSKYKRVELFSPP